MNKDCVKLTKSALKVFGYSNTATVVTPNVKACKSLQQVIDEVLIPGLDEPCQTVEQAVESNGLTTLATALTAAGCTLLSAVTSNHTPLTVFAPTNDAFASFLNTSNMTVEVLLGDVELLTTVLSYHLAPGAVGRCGATDYCAVLPSCTWCCWEMWSY
ncbi:hypothetical protein CEUSTIGMA_g4133.t1 [Chlamydomonas eustigma]|uniref:FAS1 domain-containing protein n=1 Tax=Chlamydomonas eustigma TaxID=1157962 RepID=A0A250X0T6_9CHLO|nr:hypothetical protein CEUSTIGMA_g4133.t1 [Chlamydomonas eustigma]|eukprot:GAX76687.1 hypothetical protein CEUSTIGMA_g4133.t1 [Chlamydomonas eustigma]